MGAFAVESAAHPFAPPQARDDHVPHVIAWNLTRRCNLECAHCYISAGPHESVEADLRTDECLRIAGEILAVNRAPLFILSGGEPLLRDDLETIASFASSRGATVVVGTNGTLLTDERIASLMRAGVTGVAVSIDSLDAHRHDAFRHGAGAFEATAAAIARLRAHRLDFIVQTMVTRRTRAELGQLVTWAAEQGAVSFNAYFLVATGRGARLTDLTSEEYESALAELVVHHRSQLGRMMVRAKCAPQFMRLVHQLAPESPIADYSTRCPCGTQYCRITPDGQLTPCPYIPTSAGDLRSRSFADIWREAPLFRELRGGGTTLGGRCGRCEYRAVCGGCRARALALTGDMLAEDPSCVHDPVADAPLVEPPHATAYGMSALPPRTLVWSAEAESRMKRVPSFVRGVVMRRLEEFARERGATEITVDLLRDVREAMPVDFSRRRPFFLGED
jgi:radical SAM protein with 4Fe4S-binding SPASM domain